MKFVANKPQSNLRVVCEPRRVSIIDGRQIMHPGFSAQFVSGVFLTDNADEIKMLRKNPAFGREFQEAIVPPAPKAPAVEPKPKKKTKKR